MNFPYRFSLGATIPSREPRRPILTRPVLVLIPGNPDVPEPAALQGPSLVVLDGGLTRTPVATR